MQASTRYTIAIHICIYLNYKGNKLTTSQTISESVKTNPVVIRRLLPLLKKRDIVGSVAGANGGFFLARPASEISLWDIYLAVRDDHFFNKPKVNDDCIVSSNLADLVDDIYTEAELSMKSVLNKKNIGQLTSRLKKLLREKEAALVC